MGGQRTRTYPNLQTITGTADDPKLPENSIDAVLILKAYHEIQEPIRLMENLRRSLRPGALVGIIDRNGGGGDHGISPDTVVEETSRVGYTLKDKYDFVKADGQDYFLVLQVK